MKNVNFCINNETSSVDTSILTAPNINTLPSPNNAGILAAVGNYKQLYMSNGATWNPIISMGVVVPNIDVLPSPESIGTMLYSGGQLYISDGMSWNPIINNSDISYTATTFNNTPTPIITFNLLDLSTTAVDITLIGKDTSSLSSNIYFIKTAFMRSGSSIAQMAEITSDLLNDMDISYSYTTGSSSVTINVIGANSTIINWKLAINLTTVT